MAMAWPCLLRKLLMLAYRAGRKPVPVQPTMQALAAALPLQPAQQIGLRRHLCTQQAVQKAEQSVLTKHLAKWHHLLGIPRASKATAILQAQMGRAARRRSYQACRNS